MQRGQLYSAPAFFCLIYGTNFNVLCVGIDVPIVLSRIGANDVIVAQNFM